MIKESADCSVVERESKKLRQQPLVDELNYIYLAGEEEGKREEEEEEVT